MSSQLDANKLYPVETKVVQVDGISLGPGKKGGTVDIQRKGFLNSYNPRDHEPISNLIKLLVGNSTVDRLLAVIRDDTAKIYRDFPVVLNVRTKEDIKAFTAVFQNQILDINEVHFKDAIFSLDIADGDKIIWLFRERWSFGLYFDLSGKLNSHELSKELGTCFRTLMYYSLYSRLDDDSFKALLERGWFPFVELIPKDYENLANCARKSEHLKIIEEGLLKKFDLAAIQKLSEKWWRNEIFLSKRTIIEAGLTAFLAGDQPGAINCIKNLFSEIEGVLRIDYLKKNKRNPTFSDLKTYVKSQGENKFVGAGSLGFPGLFFDYLDQVTFKNFDLINGDVDLSRHSSGHGVASDGQYSRERALQLILTLDQIYHYLSGDL